MESTHGVSVRVLMKNRTKRVNTHIQEETYCEGLTRRNVEAVEAPICCLQTREATDPGKMM